MIKNIYYVRVAKDEAEFAQMERFFAALGLDKGTAWQGRHNKGLLFRTPQAGIEVFAGEDAPTTEVVFEVANADTAYEVCKREGFKGKEEGSDRGRGGRRLVGEGAPGGSGAIF